MNRIIFILLLLIIITSCKGQENNVGKLKHNKVVNSIISEAIKHQVVMINEDHKTSKHRVFSETLLKPLYDLGFRYLAIETLSEKDTFLNIRKFPIQQTGTYSNEPNYANFIRTALEMGYTLVPYEIRMDEEDELGENNFITFREECQARHLAELIQKKPKAKIFVHAGGDHIREKTKTKWMAERFYEKTRIDPLTISQTHLKENPNIDGIKIHKIPNNKYGVDILLEYPNDKNIINQFYSILNRKQVKFESGTSLKHKIYLTKERKEFGENAIPVSVLSKTNKTFLMPNNEYLISTKNGLKTFKIEEKDTTINLN